MNNAFKLFIVLFTMACFCVGFTQRTTLKRTESCISKEEKKLYDLIMVYRKQKGLKPIPFSASLTKVAQAHAKDLSEHAPYKKSGCNFHSWSDQGTWKSCCYDAKHSNPQCMWNKPRELAQFNADGYEIAYGSESSDFVVDAEKALTSWKGSSGHNMVMVNKGIWKDYAWKSIGIGIYKNFACVWFAKELDEPMVLTICD